MPIARDESLAPPLWPNGSRNRSGYLPPEILFDDNFDRGFGNWRNHQSGNSINPPISRTSLRAFNGSSKSLMMSTGPRPQNSTNGAKTGTCSTYNNMSRWVNSGLVEFQSWYTVGGFDLDQSPHNLLFGIDTQQWDDKSRGFYRLMCRRWTGGDTSALKESVEPTWGLVDDKAGQVVIPAMDGSPAPVYPGDNENKMNWNYVSLTVDLDYVGADGYKGRYHQAQIGPYVYDLTQLGAGRGKQNPQVASSVGAGSFAGGLNFGMSLGNRSVYKASGPSWLLCGRARGLWYPKAGK